MTDEMLMFGGLGSGWLVAAALVLRGPTVRYVPGISYPVPYPVVSKSADLSRVRKEEIALAYHRAYPEGEPPSYDPTIPRGRDWNEEEEALIRAGKLDRAKLRWNKRKGYA